MLAVDFFHVDCAVTFAAALGPVRARGRHVLGVTGHLDGSWMTQARNLVMELGDGVRRLRLTVRSSRSVR